MQKVRCYFCIKIIKASTDCLHYILGSFNSKKVLFHLSLTVLVYYRLLKIKDSRVDPRLKQIYHNSLSYNKII